MSVEICGYQSSAITRIATAHREDHGDGGELRRRAGDLARECGHEARGDQAGHITVVPVNAPDRPRRRGQRDRHRPEQHQKQDAILEDPRARHRAPGATVSGSTAAR